MAVSKKLPRVVLLVVFGSNENNDTDPLLRFLGARATVPVGQRHVQVGSGRGALEGVAVGAGPATTVPVGQRHMQGDSESWALEGVAVGEGAGIGCLNCGGGHHYHTKLIIVLLLVVFGIDVSNDDTDPLLHIPGARATVPVGPRHLRCGSDRRALEGVTLGAGAGLGR